MGAEQSSPQNEADARVDSQESTKRCYYDVLGVDHQASDDSIKKAYRTKALELHPDRNYGNVENSTKKFADVQSAYQVLSDPQERAWYDSHRDAILRNDDPGSDEHFEYNVRLTGAGDIVRLISKFTTSIPFTDGPNGFFGIFRSMFATLAKEETAACNLEGLDAVQYPSFGDAGDSYEGVVRPFYAAWMGFATRKTYSWKDAYKYTEAPDRRIRRLMEKKNKRLRDEGVREFNDSVKSLVVFVRKRDPRYTPNLQSEADRQKGLRDAAIAQAARSRAANQAKLDAQSLPRWAQTRDAEEDELFSESGPSDEERYECIVCAKVFKSENQYETHEKSKKHIKAIQRLKREMRKENKKLNIDSKTLTNGDATPRLGPRHSNSNIHIEMIQTGPPLEGFPAEPSNSEYNVARLPTNTGHENGANLIRELGASTWPISASEEIIGSSGDGYTSREQVECRLSSLAISDVKSLQETDYSVHDKVLAPNANAIASDANGQQH